MKTRELINKTVVLGSLSCVLFLNACQEEDYENQYLPAKTTKAPDETNQKALEDNYNNAKIYNDSLVMCHNGAIAKHDSITMYNYDKSYHRYDSLMQQHHNKCHNQTGNTNNTMMNNGNGGMMGNNSGMMNGKNGNMNCGCNNDVDNHTQIETLHTYHSKYHYK